MFRMLTFLKATSWGKRERVSRLPWRSLMREGFPLQLRRAPNADFHHLVSLFHIFLIAWCFVLPGCRNRSRRSAAGAGACDEKICDKPGAILGKIALHILGSAALLTMMISSFSGRAGGVGQDGGGGPGCAAPHLEGCAMLAKQDIPMISSNAGGPDERRGLADWESCRDCQACHQ